MHPTIRRIGRFLAAHLDPPLLLTLAWYFGRYEATLKLKNFVIGAVLLIVPAALHRSLLHRRRGPRCRDQRLQ